MNESKKATLRKPFQHQSIRSGQNSNENSGIKAHSIVIIVISFIITVHYVKSLIILSDIIKSLTIV